MAKGKKGNVIKIDMTGVESNNLVDEGEYAVEVLEVEQKISKSTEQPMLVWQLGITTGEFKGSKLYYNTSLQKQALFNLKNVLIALGVSVPSSVMKLDLDQVIGLEMGVQVAHDLYDGKKRPKITDVFPLDAEDAEEEEADYSDMDLDELKEELKARGIAVPKKATTSRLIAILEEDDESSQEDGNEEEEEVEESEEAEDDSEEEEDDEEAEEINYEELDLKELKALCKERGITFSKKATEKTLIKKLTAADEEEDV